jgi:hypothetical protein
MSDTSPQHSGDHSGDRSGEGRWLTYDELGRIRGIGRESAVKLVQRKRWRRIPGNDGVARALVPDDWLTPAKTDTEEHSPEHSLEHSPGVRAFETALAAIEAAHASEVAALREQIAAADRERIGMKALMEQFAGQVAVADEAFKLERTRAEAEIDQLRAEVEAAKIALAEAEADTAELRQAEEAARVERTRSTAEIDRERARADAQRERADDLQAGQELMMDMHARALAAALDRTQAEARKAREAEDALRQAETDRKARGLLARLRAAARGR